ncbi:TonB-dependent receptor [Novosphingobium arvoryzae]|uniref:TonB-dependent receptor n=1 Tax=Novosphingobium arvoryzae TaxID=1256514 RepID=UPI0035B1C61B
MRLNFALTAATSGLAIGVAALATPAFAQSVGSVDFEKEIIVTGTRSGTQEVGGVSAPDTSKAKAVLTAENIQRQNPGQTILDTINQIPGVSFQNNDAYGSSGGTLSIRGFSSDRISLTFDGVPLNDSGNYAIYSNQQIDPELIEQVNVNLGTTDVDSPTASAVGGTVNLRSKKPDHDMGVMLSGSAGEFDFMRLFAKIETGDLTESGLRAWVSASRATNDNPFNNYGKVNKQQYNAKIYQPLGGDDFFSLSGHYNQNRNNFFGSLPLRTDTTQSIANQTLRVAGPLSGNRFPITKLERFYTINAPCMIPAGVNGTADAASTCGTEFDRRYNPSNTGNVRAQLRLTLADNLVLNVEPSYQYVKANGGGTVTGEEGLRDINPAGGTANLAACRTTPTSATNSCVTGYIGGRPYFGRDVNGDGDMLDSVTVIAPSQTQTHRIGVIAGLRYEMDESNTLRLTYTFDRARHRQTGEVGAVAYTGEPLDVFPVNEGLKDSTGTVLQKRDRLSYAVLHQVSGEYRGEFFDNRLTVTAGVRAPFFRRDLNQNCFTTSAGGFVDCFGTNSALNSAYATLNPAAAGPQQRVFNFSKVLPNVGFTYDVIDNVSVFANFSQGLSVPGTDSLYNAFFFAPGTAGTKPKPETTDNFDLGVRYRSGKVQASISGYYNQFRNRLASAYDPVLDQNVYRNLGNVKKYGLDGYVAYQPVDFLTFYAFGSVMKSEIRDNIAIGENTDGTPIYAPTAGKREAGAPKYSWGGTVRGRVGPVELGITAKRTGERYVYDTNEATFQGSFVPLGAKTSTGATPALTAAQQAATGQIYGATAPAYWLVNLDMRLSLEGLGLNDQTYLQLNVYNLTDSFYVGGFGGGLVQSNTFNRTTGVSSYGSPGFVQIGAPRTVSGTVVFKF